MVAPNMRARYSGRGPEMPLQPDAALLLAQQWQKTSLADTYTAPVFAAADPPTYALIAGAVDTVGAHVTMDRPLTPPSIPTDSAPYGYQWVANAHFTASVIFNPGGTYGDGAPRFRLVRQQTPEVTWSKMQTLGGEIMAGQFLLQNAVNLQLYPSLHSWWPVADVTQPVDIRVEWYLVDEEAGTLQIDTVNFTSGFDLTCWYSLEPAAGPG